MASFSVPCPKVSPMLAASLQPTQKLERVSFPLSGFRSNPASIMAHLQGCSRGRSDAFKVSARVNEVAVEKVSNSTPLDTSLITKSEKEYEVPDAPSFPTFMSQVADLVKLVDSKDIMELELKQKDFEVLIRKKEALPQPPIGSPVMFTPPPTQQSILPTHLPPANVQAPPAASVPSPPASAPVPPAPGKPKSSHPPFKCPMAGNFYRSPGPGLPPFVKVGDKVQKGQVLCIIEAMKLMNEIEADQSGTVVEILADDGKPVSVDTPLFIIEP